MGLCGETSEVLQVSLPRSGEGQISEMSAFLRRLLSVMLTVHKLGTDCPEQRHGREILHRICSHALSGIPFTNVIYSETNVI